MQLQERAVTPAAILIAIAIVQAGLLMCVIASHVAGLGADGIIPVVFVAPWLGALPVVIWRVARAPAPVDRSWFLWMGLGLGTAGAVLAAAAGLHGAASILFWVSPPTALLLAAWLYHAPPSRRG